MAIAKVSNHADNVTGNGTTGPYSATAVNTPASTLIVVAAVIPRGGAVQISAISDTIGNTYISDANFTDSGGNVGYSVWHAYSASSNASNVVAVTLSATIDSGHGMALEVCQWSGTSGAVDVAITGSVTVGATSFTSTSFTPVTAGALGIMVGGSETTGSPNFSAGTNYTLLDNVPNIASGGRSGGFEYRLGLAASSQTASCNWSATVTGGWIVCTFNPATASGSGAVAGFTGPAGWFRIW